jgi:putative PIN family toxin of toxin-antitoxin system
VLRAVLDANVLASAFIRPLGPSGRILSALVERNAFRLVLSTPILDEVRRVLFYPRLRKELPESDVDILMRVAALAILADLADGDLIVKTVKADPDDDKYLSAALLGRADVLVSGDHHLLDLKEYQGVRILKPRAFLELL